MCSLFKPVTFDIADLLFLILASEQYGEEEKKIIGVLYLMSFDGHLL